MSGHVASIHLHPPRAGQPLRAVPEVEAVAGQGLRGNGRHFGRVSTSPGRPSKRQVTLIEREQLDEHAATLGLERLAPGAVRSNLETTGIRLVELVGRQVRVGDAVLFLYEARTPCEKMDRLCQGLRAAMEDKRQGVLAQVVCGGTIRVGDPIEPLPEDAPGFNAPAGR